ncbi:hypothetical protein [Streptomyces turgidiscabies]|uniref:hypothetical protein n=1 Tax=Streptomyces turgidiscabies TaxID=85558 RepID=UPI0038F6C858
MTGPEHYRRAQDLLSTVTSEEGRVRRENGDEVVIAVAQVHATLALAAATALTTMTTRASTRTIRQWHTTAGSGPTPEDDLG